MAQEPYLVSLRRLIDEEQADCAFYHLAAQSSQGTPSAQIFEELSRQEAQHTRQLQQLYRTVASRGYSGTGEHELVIDRDFGQMLSRRLHREMRQAQEFLQLQAWRRNPAARETLGRLALEETMHSVRLLQLENLRYQGLLSSEIPRDFPKKT